MSQNAIVVTGASSGLGRHITNRLVNDGRAVLAVARRGDRLESLAEAVETAPGALAFSVTDVTDPTAVKRMVDLAVDRFGGIDALVNNAGMEIQAGIADLAEEEFRAMLDTNVIGPYLCTRESLRHLEESRGSVVNIGSTVVTRAPRDRFGYVASKGALEAMTRALAGDLGPSGIRVNVVRPGIVPSELRGSSESEEAVTLTERAPRLQALPEIGSGSDVAALVAFLVSEQARWITGAVFDVDGGYSLGWTR
jgi:NAD(P)-dependent dehydrogenase (short-subunit alcohol dehydrogenase family)